MCDVVNAFMRAKRHAKGIQLIRLNQIKSRMLSLHCVDARFH